MNSSVVSWALYLLVQDVAPPSLIAQAGFAVWPPECPVRALSAQPPSKSAIRLCSGNACRDSFLEISCDLFEVTVRFWLRCLCEEKRAKSMSRCGNFS